MKRFLSKLLNIESRFVIGPSKILFAGVYMCAFQLGNVTGFGSEGASKLQLLASVMNCHQGAAEEDLNFFLHSIHLQVLHVGQEGSIRSFIVVVG